MEQLEWVGYVEWPWTHYHLSRRGIAGFLIQDQHDSRDGRIEQDGLLLVESVDSHLLVEVVEGRSGLLSCGAGWRALVSG